MGERLNGIQEVVGSIPIISTIRKACEYRVSGSSWAFLLSIQNMGKAVKNGGKS